MFIDPLPETMLSSTRACLLLVMALCTTLTLAQFSRPFKYGVAIGMFDPSWLLRTWTAQRKLTEASVFCSIGGWLLVRRMDYILFDFVVDLLPPYIESRMMVDEGIFMITHWRTFFSFFRLNHGCIPNVGKKWAEEVVNGDSFTSSVNKKLMKSLQPIGKLGELFEIWK